MSFFEVLKILGEWTNPVFWGIVGVWLFFLWKMHNTPIEEIKEWDTKTGRLTKHHRKYRKW